MDEQEIKTPFAPMYALSRKKGVFIAMDCGSGNRESGRINTWIPVLFAAALSLCVCISIVYVLRITVSQTLREQEAKYETRIAEAVETAAASRDKEIKQLFNWYVELRRDLYTEWAKGVKPIKGIGGGK
jgi:hypothetical protein